VENGEKGDLLPMIIVYVVTLIRENRCSNERQFQ
jgi:hypothetical protein